MGSKVEVPCWNWLVGAGYAAVCCSFSFRRRRWIRNAAKATRERMVQPPIVPPTIGPRDCFFSPVALPVEDGLEVGVFTGEAVTVITMTGVDVGP